MPCNATCSCVLPRSHISDSIAILSPIDCFAFNKWNTMIGRAKDKPVTLKICGVSPVVQTVSACSRVQVTDANVFNEHARPSCLTNDESITPAASDCDCSRCHRMPATLVHRCSAVQCQSCCMFHPQLVSTRVHDSMYMLQLRSRHPSPKKPLICRLGSRPPSILCTRYQKCLSESRKLAFSFSRSYSSLTSITKHL